MSRSQNYCDPHPAGIPRREFIRRATGAATAIVASEFFVDGVSALVEARAEPKILPHKNILLIITDQERPPMWFPPKWAEGDATAQPPIPANLPFTQRLRRFGLTFTHAFTAAAMCTPSRNCMFTGLYPAQHRSTWTLTEDTEQAFEEHQLDPTLPNIATCLKEAGYDVIYKGKWHMSKRVRNADGQTYTEDDLARYGFDGWDAPDAGGDARFPNFGGADAPRTVHNDQRFIDDAISFLEKRLAQPAEKRFCLIVSLVNPHDVLSYPSRYADLEGKAVPGGYKDGYDDEDPWIALTTPEIELPPTVDETPLTNDKPSAQAGVALGGAVALGPLPTPESKRNYLNFYGRLMKAVDTQIGQLLDVLDPAGDGTGSALRDTIIIRTSDHGEMAMCHGGLRQKAFVAYDEVIRIPLIWSNPELFPTPKTTSAMVSHVDLLPTLCALTGVAGKEFKGVDYSHVILNPDANASPTAVQNHVVFTFDDIYAASDRATQGAEGAIPPPNCIQMVRTPEFKLVRYWDPEGTRPDQGEFYDLTPEGGDYYTNDGSGGSIVYSEAGPLELKNLHRALPGELTPRQLTTRLHLQQILESLGQTTLAPRGPDNSTAPPPTHPSVSVRRWTDSNGVNRADVQLTFYSRENETYQLQRSTDFKSWENVSNRISGDGPGDPTADPSQPVRGNNGPIALSDDLSADCAFYRLLQTKT
jgi:arylsulfatase A-like enzyme